MRTVVLGLLCLAAAAWAAPKTEKINGRDAVANEVVVKLRNLQTLSAASTLDRDADAENSQEVGHGRQLRLIRSKSKNVNALLKLLASRPEVEYAEPNYVIRSTATPNDPQFGTMWQLNNTGQAGGIPGSDIQAAAAWDLTRGTASVAVGVLDSGVDYNHPDLVPNLWSAPTPFTVTVADQTVTCPAGTRGFNAVTFTCNPLDDHGHGTHVSGTIGAAGNNGVGVTGINWTSKILALKMLDSTGNGTTVMAVNAIDAAIQINSIFAGTAAPLNLRVLSASWGGSGYSQALVDAISRANSADMLFVAASGNSGVNTDSSPNYPSAFSLPNLISVAATDSADNLASFSNYGASTVDLGAPGVYILSTTLGGGYGAWDGTSMATPQVSGVAALALSYCSLSTTALRNLLLQSVDPRGSLTGKTTTGGRLNAYKTLRNCAPAAFSVSVAPSSVTVVRGQSRSSAITLTPANGFTGTVSLSVAGLPAGVSASFSSSSLPVSGTLPASAALNIATTAAAPVGTWTLTVTATSGGLTRTAPLALTITAATQVATGTASFIKLDSTTSGSWQGFYGADGFNLNARSESLPAYASMVPSGNSIWTWATQTADLRGLQNAPPSGDRASGCWYSAGAFQFDLAFSDGAVHQVAVYMVDWDALGRTQRVEVLDGTGTVLDTRNVSGFSGGRYLVWNLSGRVSIRVTNTSPRLNAVVSGVFFGGGWNTGAASFVRSDTSTAGNWTAAYGSAGYNVIGDAARYPSYVVPSVSGNSTYVWANPTADGRGLLKGPPAADRIAAVWYSSSSFEIALPFSDGAVHQVSIYMADWDASGRSQRVEVFDSNGNLLDTRNVAGFSGGQYLVWNLSGRVVLRVTNTAPGLNAVVNGIFFGTGYAGGAAAFAGTDTSTSGNWKGVYGTSGYALVGDSAALPAYVSLTPSENSSWLWAGSTADTRALQKPTSATDRAAGCWYSSSSFQVDLAFTDGVAHQVALYMVDWDRIGRNQRIDVLDAGGNLLDSRSISGFGSGTYLVWNLSGHVHLRITNANSNLNAVLSGIFIR